MGNMCRKGRMFAPLRTWRKWHRKVNTKQKRHAVAACLAASACAPLVLARGHRVNAVPELPMVANLNSHESTGAMLSALQTFGATADLARVRASKNMRAGQGKLRNARFTMRKGPLLVFNDEDSNVHQNARNLPGVDTCNVHRLNLLQLAPGGHLGRFVIYTPSAFAALDNIFGTATKAGVEKGGYTLNRTSMECADLARIINSDQVQSRLREIKTSARTHDKTKKNPLKNRQMMQKVRPRLPERYPEPLPSRRRDPRPVLPPRISEETDSTEFTPDLFPLSPMPMPSSKPRERLVLSTKTPPRRKNPTSECCLVASAPAC